MAKIILENDIGETVIAETNNIDNTEAVAPDGTVFILKQQPSNLPGERWDTESGETYWRGGK